MKKHVFFTFFTLLFFSISLFGQTDEREKSYKLVLSPGLSNQNHKLFGELNLMYLHAEGGPCSLPAMWGPRIGVESNFDSKNWVYAPKIGYEFDVLLLSVRANVLRYKSTENVDIRLLSEVGLTLAGVLSVNYGYSVPIGSYKMETISKHRVSFTANLWGVLPKKKAQ
jgi:hypothetical protein